MVIKRKIPRSTSFELPADRQGSRKKKTSVYEQYQKEYRSVSSKSSLSKYPARTIRNPNIEPRIAINVKGHRYETYIDTLNRFPNTLLGNAMSREKYYNAVHDEIVLSRDFQVFEAVLFYYQSDGILARPTWISEAEFNREIAFYELTPKPRPKERTKDQTLLNVVWNLMEHPHSSVAAHLCAIVSIITIVVSIIVFCLETEPNLVKLPDQQKVSENKHILFCFETSVIVWFTLEYVLRLVSAPKRLKFICSFVGIIDLVVVLPYYINISVKEEIKVVNLSVFRILRMFRVFRVFKLTRYSTGLKVLGKTIVESLDQLCALFLCFFLSAILFASCLYYIEHVSSPTKEDFSNVFISIPDTLWYVMITMTTVGYGDVIPETYVGRIVAAFCMVCGIVVLLCLPTPVFITHFGRFYEDCINKMSEEQTEDIAESEIWKNNEQNLLVPTWVRDSVFKEKIRNDYKQTLLMPAINVYLSNTSLNRACSMEYLQHSSLAEH